MVHVPRLPDGQQTSQLLLQQQLLASNPQSGRYGHRITLTGRCDQPARLVALTRLQSFQMTS